MPKTKPIAQSHPEPNDVQTLVEPHIKTADGAEYVHADLVKVVEPWAVETHIGPPKGVTRLGTVGSWAEFVKRYGKPESTLLTWDEYGFGAQLDYHNSGPTGDWGRNQWEATMPFAYAKEWNDWIVKTRGSYAHREVIEFIEDHAPDIVKPDASHIATILQALRANVNSTAITTLNPDGSTQIDFTQTRTVKGNAIQKQNETELPQAIEIAIPVLKGHIDDKGKPVRYKMTVRIRPSVDENAKLTFRFTIPQAEQVKEEVLQEQVADARTRLTDYELYRAG